MPTCTSKWKRIRESLKLSRFRLLAAALIVLTAVWSITLSPAAVAQTEQIEIQSLNARYEFPTSVTYSVSATAPADIIVAELYWHATEDPALTLEQPEFEPSTEISIQHSVDMLVNYLPPGAELSYQWRFEDRNGNSASSPEQTLRYSDLRFDWRQVSSGPITVWWYRGDESFGNDILNRAGLSLADLSDQFDIFLNTPVNIVVYGNDSDFSSAMPPNSADWIGGVAYSNLNLIVAQISPGSGSAGEIDRLISHEMSHLAVHQATENSFNSPPNWLDEGLATYNQAFPDERFTRALDDAIEDGTLIPVRALNSAFPLDDRQALLSYAESWSLIQYLVDVYGDQAVADLVAVFKQEVSYEDALMYALNLTYEELDAGWKAWLGYQGDNPDAAPQPAFQNDDDGVAPAIWIAAGIFGLLACFLVLSGTLIAGFWAIRRRSELT